MALLTTLEWSQHQGGWVALRGCLVAEAVLVALRDGGGVIGALQWVSTTATCVSCCHWGVGAQGAPMTQLTAVGWSARQGG